MASLVVHHSRHRHPPSALATASFSSLWSLFKLMSPSRGQINALRIISEIELTYHKRYFLQIKSRRPSAYLEKSILSLGREHGLHLYLLSPYSPSIPMLTLPNLALAAIFLFYVYSIMRIQEVAWIYIWRVGVTASNSHSLNKKSSSWVFSFPFLQSNSSAMRSRRDDSILSSAGARVSLSKQRHGAFGYQNLYLSPLSAFLFLIRLPNGR